MTKLITLLILVFGLFAANAFSQKVALRDAAVLCNRVAKIKELPHYDESGVDKVYDALAKAGDSVVPCLIEKITDTKVTRDPNCPRMSAETKVGDVAYFVLVRITKIGFIELFPADVQEKYKTEGTYAYYDYIEREGSRRELQARLREWYRQKQGVGK